MDSLTQIALGAAVGEATLGRKVGSRAILWGAICGTVPDLDVFIPLGDAVMDFTYHRSFSHSLFVLAILTPVFVWLIKKMHPQTQVHSRGWYGLVYLCFATHVLLDSFTVYGTQIFWPLVTVPMTWSTVFIIDPAYTLPLLVGVIVALMLSRANLLGHNWNKAGLVISSVYLVWSLGAKLYVNSVTEQTLSQQNIQHDEYLAMATPFNTLLWRILVVDDKEYRVGYFSLLDNSRSIKFGVFPKNKNLLVGIEEEWSVKRLQWFTKGFYSVSSTNQDIVINDLRMGLEPNFVFRFKVGEISNPHANATPVLRVPNQHDWDKLPDIWKRIFNENMG